MTLWRRTALFTLGVAAALVAVYFTAASTGAPERSPGVTLLVNHAANVEVAPGAPLLFEISISSGPTDPPQSIGSRWMPWYRLVRLEGLPAGSPAAWPLPQGGQPRSLEMVRDSGGRSSVKAVTGPVAQLAGGRIVHTVAFSASPEDTAKLAPGDYVVRAVIETPFWLRWGWHGRVFSTPARVTVRRPGGEPEQVRAFESDRLARAARYYLGAGETVKALRVAQELVTLEPERARSYVLLGDALVLERRAPEALTALRHAMKLVPRSHEQPELLRQRIVELARDEQEQAKRAGAESTRTP